VKKSIPGASPDDYVSALSGWQRLCVEVLRSTVRGSAATVRRLAKEASALNGTLGDPTKPS